MPRGKGLLRVFSACKVEVRVKQSEQRVGRGEGGVCFQGTSGEGAEAVPRGTGQGSISW